MPLSTAQKAELQAKIQSVEDFAGGLVAEDVNPLQATLDAANATIVSLNTKIASAAAKIVEANLADVAEEAADTAGDSARAEALTILQG